MKAPGFYLEKHKYVSCLLWGMKLIMNYCRGYESPWHVPVIYYIYAILRCYAWVRVLGKAHLSFPMYFIFVSLCTRIW